MCNRCSCKFIVSTGLDLSASNLEINIAPTTFTNGERFGLYIAQEIPSNGTPVPVVIEMAGTEYPLLKPCGNYVMSDQLRTQRSYCVRCGTNPNHFTIANCNRLCGTQFVPGQLVPAATTTASTETSAG